MAASAGANKVSWLRWFNGELVYYIISGILHVIVVTILVFGNRKWPNSRPAFEPMMIDMIVAEEIADRSAQQTKTGMPGGKLSDVKKDIQSTGDTSLQSKSEQVYAKPIVAQEESDSEDSKSDGAKNTNGSAQSTPTNSEPPKDTVNTPKKAILTDMPVGLPNDAMQEDAKLTIDSPVIQDTEDRSSKESPSVQKHIDIPKPISMPEKEKAISTVENPAKAKNAASPLPKKRPEHTDEHMEKVLKAVKQYKQEIQANREGQGNIESDGQLAVHLAQYVQNQLIQCWNIPVMTSDVDIKIHIRATFDINGNISDIAMLNSMRGDPLYDVVESSAIRAIRQCSPLHGLPTDKHYLWRSMNLVFDPRKAVYS